MNMHMLLWPHANARYQAETVRLACAEAEIMLHRLAPDAAIEIAPLEGGAPGIGISLEGELNAAALDALSRHSLMYALFAVRPDGAYEPLRWPERAYLGGDLPGILKYKGKTNERFLRLLINLSLYSGEAWKRQMEALSFYDPMCARATAPFEALNRGWNAAGTDIDKTDISEADHFFKRYLEYHRLKHTRAVNGRTLPDKKSAPVIQYTYADTAEAFKGKNVRALSLSCADAREAKALFGANSFDVIAADLPYGVQHSSSGGISGLLKRTLPAMKDVLKKNCAVALSFNNNSLTRQDARACLAEAGFEVMEGGAYDSFEHWVEQAVTRDVVAGVKTR